MRPRTVGILVLIFFTIAERSAVASGSCPTIAWPKGTFGLVKTDSGCPSGSNSAWQEGSRLHDTEDDGPIDTQSSSYNLAGRIANSHYIMQWEFCIKTSNGNNDVDHRWPAGAYCILRYGGACPSGFSGGRVYWDDEDTNNVNNVDGTLPDGTYDEDTEIEFCCRNDGAASNRIFLPTNRPFILLAATSVCQNVDGMHVQRQWHRWNDEDTNNDNYASGFAPFGAGGSDHALYFCYYSNECPTPVNSNACADNSKACLIGGTCYANGARRSSTGNGGCEECSKLASQYAWTDVSGGSCDDTQACTKDDQCRDGVCSGTAFTCESCETCNGAGCTLNPGHCLIDSECRNRDEKNPFSQCQACKPDTFTVRWTPLTNTLCDDGDLCTYSDKCTSSGLCVGTSIPGQCSLPCQACDGSSTCKITSGCLSNSNTCGCQIGATCYENNAENPLNQCQHCNFGNSASSWTNDARGTACDDGNACTRNDVCHAGICAGADFTWECARHVVSTNPCVSGTYCDGFNCLPTNYTSSRQCYVNVDECDYPDLNCEGGRAECRYCTGGNCVSVHPDNSPKPATGVDLSTAAIFVYKSGTQTLLSLKVAPNGVSYLMITDNNSIKVKFQNFKVPCDRVTIDWRLVTAVGETNVFPQQTVTTTSAGTVDVSASNQFALTNGAVYKIKVTAKNVRNAESMLDSSLILVDVTAPVIGTIYDGDRPQQADITYQLSNSRISAHWDPNTVYDSESGLETTNTYQIAVGTSALSTNIRGYVTVQANFGEINLSLQHNTIYYVTLRVYNRAGLASTRSSNGVKVDTTNPVTGTLTIVKSTSDYTRLDYVTSPARRLVARLQGCNDPESGITEIRWTVCLRNVNNVTDTACNGAGYQVYSSCSNPADCLIDVTLPQDDRVLLNGNFQSGYSYHLRLIIKNGALRTSSITSTKFITDYSSPDAGTVRDGLSGNIDYQHVNTSVDVNWSGFTDEQSQLDYCQLAVYEEYNTASQRVVSSFSGVPLTGSVTVTSLSGVLVTGKTYKPVVRCYNKAGLFTDVASDGVLIDAFPPVPTEIKDIRFEDDLADENVDRDYQVLLTGIKTKWRVFPSVSGLQSCEWSLKNDSQEIVSEQGIPPTSTTYSHPLTTNLTLYTPYYASVRCTSRAGLSATGTSNGIAPDNTNPLPGVVFDLCPDSCGLSTDVAYSPSADALRFRWEGFADLQSGVDFYEWNYNQDCSGLDILSSYKNVGVSYEVNESLPLIHNTLYCVTVRAVNGAGLKVASVSNGILVDTTRPRDVIVKDGANPSTDIDYQSSNSVVAFTWPLIQDPESYIALLEVGLGSSFGDDDAVALTTVANTTTSHTFDGLNLVQNQVYYAKVCATNGARLRTCIHSDGVLIDVTPPVDGVVIHGIVRPGNAYQITDTNIAAHWYGFKDLESAVDHFEWAIGTTMNGTDVMNYTDVGANVTFSVDVGLVNGQKYFVSVICYNNAGLQIAGSSSGVTVDVTRPVAPSAASIMLEISVGEALNASWADFTDAESPMWYYKWAIGTEECGTQVRPYTNVGLKTRASYAVAFVSGLRYYVSVAGRNRAGLSAKVCSDGTLYDDSPPFTGVVRDGDGAEDIDYQSTTSSLAVNWDLFTDDHSGIKACYVGIGSRILTDDFYSFTSISVGATTHTFSSLSIASGAKYFALVRCTNGLGLNSTNSSNGITIDTTPPIVGSVKTRPYQSSLDVIEASWSDFSDAESHIESYWWSIDGGTPQSQSVQSFVNARLNEAVRAKNLTLRALETYYVTVRAFNKAGLYSAKSSTGLLVDVSPPRAGYVIDGTGQEDIDWHYADTGIGATWYNFTDEESDVLSYRWSVGGNEEGCQVLLATDVTLNTSAFCSNCSFVPGVKYYVTVEATNGVGLKSTASSDGFIVDLTRPKPGTISGLTWISNDYLQVNWTGASDDESGPPQCWIIVLAPGLWTMRLELHNLDEQTMNFNTTGYPYSKLVSVYVNCTNVALLTASSPSASIDGTPPTAGSVDLLRYDDTSFTVKWEGFRDTESIVRSIEVQISSNSSTDTVLLPPYDGPVYERQGESLYGTRQIVTARAFSNVGLVSSSVEAAFDLAAPTNALDSAECCHVTMEYINETIHVSWDWRNGLNNKSVDLGYQYRYSIGTVPGGTQILNYTNVGATRKAICTSCLLLQGASYYVSLHFTLNDFNTYNDYQSNGFLIDLTPPVAGEVFDGDFYTTEENFQVTWTGFTDPESSIETCAVFAIDSASYDVIWAEEFVSSTGAGTKTVQLSWNHSRAYHSKVLCRNELGLAVEAQSNGFVVDGTPPFGGSVILSLSIFQGDLVNVLGSWSGFYDDESGIAAYEWTIQNLHNRTMTQAGTITSFSASMNLTAAAEYRLIVRAINSAGLSTLRTSHGVVHDVTAPRGTYVHDGAGVADADYQFSTTGLSATWGQMIDDETDVVDCTWYVGTAPGGAELLAPRSVGARTNASCAHCILTPGMTYFSSIMCYNSAGLRTVVSSDGIVVDPTKPVPGRVYDGRSRRDKDFQMESSFSDCSWDEFRDAESGIVEYRPCLGTSIIACNIRERSGRTTSTEWRFSSVRLDHGATYYCSVTGVNAAGLSYTATSDGVTVDLTEPKSGEIIDGSVDDVDCRYANDTVVATWFGFYDSESGIANYQWGIGTSSGDDDIQRFVSVGLSQTASSSNATLPVGRMVFVAVRAYNEAGKSVVSSSDGFSLVDRQSEPATSSCVSLFNP